MKPIIDTGRLYIAQPPLYRLKKGNSTVYKKDDNDLEDYLIEEGLKNTIYKNTQKSQVAGEELKQLTYLSKKTKSNLVFRRSSLEKIVKEGHPRNVNTNLLDRVLQQEKKLDYFFEDGKYWKHLDRLDQEKIDYLDETWSRVIERD